MLRDPFFCSSFLSLIIFIVVSQQLLVNYSHNTCSLNLAHSFNLACLFEVGQEAYCTICKFNLQEQLSFYKNNPQALEIATALLQVKEGYQPNKPPSCCNQQDLPSKFFPTIHSMRENKKILPMSYLWKCCLYKTPYVIAPVREQGDVIARTPPYVRLPSDTPTRTRIFWFTSNGFLKRPILLKCWLLCLFSTRQPHAKAVP